MQQLEQRVKALEYEMKILKNEIQRTLLDVQEQVLVHYYPSLRAEEEAPSEGIRQSLESIRRKKQALGEAPDSPEAEAEVKMVSLNDVKAGQEETPGSPEGEVPPQSGEGQDQSRIMELSGWVSGTARKIGGERTGRLIQACTNKGIIAPEIESSLLRLTGLISADDAPKQVAVNEILGALLKLNELLGRGSDVEEALSLIEEANLG
ncbi:MAG: hypothetical protein SWK90_03190 [Chloroflexota bacterium]|nr:hypothetical protein [Chloroflexota bacterium]